MQEPNKAPRVTQNAATESQTSIKYDSQIM